MTKLTYHLYFSSSVTYKCTKHVINFSNDTVFTELDTFYKTGHLHITFHFTDGIVSFSLRSPLYDFNLTGLEK